MPFSGVYSFADCRMIFIFFLSFGNVVGSRLNAFSNGAGRQRAADNLSIVHHDQRLGGTTGCQIEVCLLLFRRFGNPPRIGGGWHQNSFDPVCCDYVAESDVNKSLRGKCHVGLSPFWFRGEPSAILSPEFPENLQELFFDISNDTKSLEIFAIIFDDKQKFSDKPLIGWYNMFVLIY